MSKWTKGPWRIANGTQIRSDRDQIARVNMMRNGEGKANANLIAAAPDLAESLEGLIELSQNLYFCAYPEGYSFDEEKWVIKAHAALAKARGE